MDIRLATTATDFEQATALLWDYVEWIRAAASLDPLIEQPAFADELTSLAEHYQPQTATLFVAYDRGLVIGTAALRLHDDGTGELKRLYVRPIGRGSGIADSLVRSVLGAAIDARLTSVWLESLRGVMEPALAVYRRNGFVELEGSGRTLDLDGIVVMRHDLAATRCVA